MVSRMQRGHPYRSPEIALQNVISFTCSDGALSVVSEVLKVMKHLGAIGCTREILIDGEVLAFDGDGNHKLDRITINGLSLAEWSEEWERLGQNESNRRFKRDYGPQDYEVKELEEEPSE